MGNRANAGKNLPIAHTVVQLLLSREGGAMDIQQVLSSLRSEISRIDRAITALETLDGAKGAASKRYISPSAPVAAAKQSSNRLSPAGRRRISAAAKKMWAERRQKNNKNNKKSNQKKSTAGRVISAVARQRMAEAAKRRWAEKKHAADKKAITVTSEG